MSVTIAGTSLKKMTHNGQPVKKWVHDGAVVFSAETQIYPGAAVEYIQVFNQGATNGFFVTVNAGSNLNSTVAYIPVDLTGIDTLTISGNIFNNAASGAYAGVWLANATQFGQYNIRYPYYTVGPGSSNIYYTKLYRITTETSVAQYSFDVSDLSGTYYLCVGAYCSTPFTAADIAGVRVDAVTGS